MLHDSFAEVAALLALAAAVGAVALRLHQPLVVAFIGVGILVGPAAFGWVTARDEIDLLAQIGVAVLLFIVGLKLDVHLVRHLGPVALATGIGQIVFTSLFGALIALAMGMDAVKASYVAVALTFSSTIIIVKLLSDKREIDSLHGRIAMGFLIVQDIAVVIAMMAIGSSSTDADGSAWRVLALIAVKLGGAVVSITLVMRYVLPPLLGLLAKSQELLLLFSIAWGVALAATGEGAGFSREVGAFLAGFSLASSGFREAIGARLAGVRDFLLLFFFVDLGAKLDLSTLGAELGAAVVLALFVLIGNPLIVIAIMGYMGYRRRTGFLAGLTVAQISEFSIVFVAMGIQVGHVHADALGLVTLVGLVTIAASTYMILYSEHLYRLVGPLLGPFERARPFREMEVEASQASTDRVEALVFGLGRYGGRLIADLLSRGVRVMGVDFDPEVTRELREQGVDVRFGDAEDPHLVETLPIRGVSAVVSTMPTGAANVALVKALRAGGYEGPIAVAVHNEGDGRAIEQAGATNLLYPYRDAADHAAELVERILARRADGIGAARELR